MSLLGYEPRDLDAMDNRALQAQNDARSTRPHALETTMRGRLLAKEAIIAAIIEHRIAEAVNT